jgi:hypothetical protein
MTEEDVSRFRLCIHQMGYYIFFDHNQTLTVFRYLLIYFSYLGELILEQDIEISSSGPGSKN